jgi:hypothetical protein
MLTLVVRRLLFLRPDKPGPVGTLSSGLDLEPATLGTCLLVSLSPQ